MHGAMLRITSDPHTSQPGAINDRYPIARRVAVRRPVPVPWVRRFERVPDLSVSFLAVCFAVMHAYYAVYPGAHDCLRVLDTESSMRRI